MNPRPDPSIRFSHRILLAPATIALLVACALISTPQVLATGKPKQGSAHSQIILQHHGHATGGGGAHKQIILQHHGHAKGAHSDIILQHHHH